MARSSRRRTQVIAEKVESFCNSPSQFCSGTYNEFQFTVGTRDLEDSAGQSKYLDISIKGNKIFSILCDQSGNPSVVQVTNGDRLAYGGNPSKLTRETLNGLLDIVGDIGLIPMGVRVFNAPRTNPGIDAYFIGSGDYRKPLNRHHHEWFLYKEPVTGHLLIV